MGIKNHTLVHFRHFRRFSSLLTIFPSTTVERALQIHPFLTNEPNFRKSQINVSKVLTKNYVQIDTWSSGKNKANSKPKQSQYKPNSNPIQSQNKPKQSQFIAASPLAKPEQSRLQNVERLLALEPVILIINGLE
jgi:hypothetical protein